ncbi:hypothetical protein GHK92_03500 [Nocardioides sp. dk4132]|uniref:hypothetical protein n=1 Tax=unclassified Nocardioides TaxID=2615069 RepID=UPI001297629A|nr:MULTISPECIES: hypothetical protein [unclassified Nocardioides]MQW74928.1 hypothetical protein [Nocardioides sp. dk4132]QGA07884.1 hypothetical protein GFH29_11110 [Nocardioides sp. dk884]
MTEQWNAPAGAVVAMVVVVVVLLVGLLLTLVRGRRRTAADLAAARAETEALRAEVEALARAAAPQHVTRDDHEFVITRLGDEPAGDAGDGTAVERIQPAPTVPARMFADLVLRESVVRGATLAAGVRRALAPETRNRIRFEYKREVKRSRKQRRVEAREAIAFYRAHQRAALADQADDVEVAS